MCSSQSLFVHQKELHVCPPSLYIWTHWLHCKKMRVKNTNRMHHAVASHHLFIWWGEKIQWNERWTPPHSKIFTQHHIPDISGSGQEKLKLLSRLFIASQIDLHCLSLETIYSNSNRCSNYKLLVWHQTKWWATGSTRKKKDGARKAC